jgi:hypothetical protein
MVALFHKSTQYPEKTKEQYAILGHLETSRHGVWMTTTSTVPSPNASKLPSAHRFKELVMARVNFWI